MFQKIKQWLGLSPQKPSQPIKPVKSSTVLNKKASGIKPVQKITNVKVKKSVQLESTKIDQQQKKQEPTLDQLSKTPIIEQFTPSNREAFQQKLNALPDGSTIQLWPPKAEYPGVLVINHPMTLDGQGATFWSQTGPVLLIQSQGVSLKNLRIEVTGDQKNNPQDQCAIFVKSGIDVKFDDIQVRGSVMGLPQEEGEWQYPECLNLGQLAYGTDYPFSIIIYVPVPCKILTDISGLNLQPSQLSPGLNSIQLNIEKMPEDTLVSGNIFLVSASLKRRITVTAHILSPAENSTLAIPNDILWEPETGFSQDSLQILQEQSEQTEPEVIAFHELPSFDSSSPTPVPFTIPEIQDSVEPDQIAPWSSSRIRRGERPQTEIFQTEVNLLDAEINNDIELEPLQIPDLFIQSQNDHQSQPISTSQLPSKLPSSSLPSIFEKEKLSLESVSDLSSANSERSKPINPLFQNQSTGSNLINPQSSEELLQEKEQQPEPKNTSVKSDNNSPSKRVQSKSISSLFKKNEKGH